MADAAGKTTDATPAEALRKQSTNDEQEGAPRSSEAVLRAVLEQSPDCIKVIGPDGSLGYMNRNGQCAMEIDDFGAVAGKRWPTLWPEDSRHLIEDALARANSGELVQLQAPCPTAKGNLRWWDVSVSSFETGEGQRGFVSISRDISEVMGAKDAAEAMAAEMRHRLANAYHVVGSLLSSFARGDKDKEEFASEMVDRINALAAAQTMQSESASAGNLKTLIEAVVLPYQSPESTITIGAIPVCSLDDGQVDALAVVLGELCVNSLKHGALSAGGDIQLTAQCTDDLIELSWRERSERQVTRHSRQGGKGLTIMERILAASQGTIKHDWCDAGVDVTVTLSRPS